MIRRVVLSILKPSSIAVTPFYASRRSPGHTHAPRSPANAQLSQTLCSGGDVLF